MALDMKFNIPTRKPTTEKVMESEANELNFATEETGNKIKFGDRKDTKPVVVASGSSGGKSESKDMSFDLDQQIQPGFEHTTEFTKAYHDETSKIQKLRQQTGSDRAAQSFLKSMGYDGSAAGLNDFDAFMEDRKRIVEGVNETHKSATGTGQTWTPNEVKRLSQRTGENKQTNYQRNETNAPIDSGAAGPNVLRLDQQTIPDYAKPTLKALAERSATGEYAGRLTLTDSGLNFSGTLNDFEQMFNAAGIDPDEATWDVIKRGYQNTAIQAKE